ncbi:hypothetical protein HPB47_025457 [Ixodes persulcatus]|uniref:Uncharacterized protein n=1 Tax=Ixodes persulcatus TaxID=34615 RepID=A0AC60Q3S8_IXOPE|nr:hypothetical protein HPB47_025457 [Ixodes persulcatus]
MGLEQDHSDFQISTVFDNGRLLVRRLQRASDPSTAAECALVRVPGAYSATRCSTRRTASHCPLSELHPDRDSTCLDCGDIEEYHLLRRELYAPVRSAVRQREVPAETECWDGESDSSFVRGGLDALQPRVHSGQQDVHQCQLCPYSSRLDLYANVLAHMLH